MASWPYNTKQWDILRQEILLRDNHMCTWPGCEALLVPGKKKANAAVVDHIVKATVKPELAFEPTNLRSLCKAHHDSAKQAEERRGYSLQVGPDGWPVDPRHPANGGKPARKWGYSIPHGIQPSGVPVVLVCGAPASGKSTYVKLNAQPGDTVIDFDEILERVGGRRWDFADGTKHKAFSYRDAMLRGLKDKRKGTCWLIVTAPTKAERDTWVEALGNVTVHVMDTTKDECIRRVKAEPERAHAASRMLHAIEQWFG